MASKELQDTDVFKYIEVRKIDVEGLDCEWIIAYGSDPDIRLLYLHGGAFMFGELDTHRHLFAQLAKVSCRIGGLYKSVYVDAEKQLFRS